MAKEARVEFKGGTLTSTKYKATVFDGHSHIERRVFTDQLGLRYIRINGWFALIGDLKRINKYDVDVWYEG